MKKPIKKPKKAATPKPKKHAYKFRSPDMAACQLYFNLVGYEHDVDYLQFMVEWKEDSYHVTVTFHSELSLESLRECAKGSASLELIVATLSNAKDFTGYV